MKTIYRYILPATTSDFVTIEVHQGAQFIAVGEQHGGPCIWAMVDSEARLVPHNFRIAGTGHDCGDLTPDQYIGTIVTLNGTFAYHIFDAGNSVH